MKLKCSNCGQVFETKTTDGVQKCPFCQKELRIKNSPNKKSKIEDWANNRDLLQVLNAICAIGIVITVVIAILHFVNGEVMLGLANLIYVLPLFIEMRINKYIILNTERIDAIAYKYVDELINQVNDLKTQNEELIARIERLERENDKNV